MTTDVDPIVALIDEYADAAAALSSEYDDGTADPARVRAALVAAIGALRGDLAELRRACRIGVPRPEAWQAVDPECLLSIRARDAARIHAALGSPDRPDASGAVSANDRPDRATISS